MVTYFKHAFLYNNASVFFVIYIIGKRLSV